MKSSALHVSAAPWTLPFPAAALCALLISAASPPVARAQQASAGQAKMQLEWSDAEGRAAEYFAEGEAAFLTVRTAGLFAGNTRDLRIEARGGSDAR